ncbi:uncharacterized protein E5676_scaffold250G001370 [Cucumis melo var. makuwa]|uniref:Uncharacterized protein n=1 Tax=Cucumis melo var. makuwa TaxID=1194695 RepID=A0A5D3DKA9_CUCMM|nr:uncharacterized protein E6C27_scaffold89G001450 [Cucumis melo var. makuwa]TYK24035.1 uncharacterized protein E5676_scaffold250G001370 [Cucumis melo var. makuwa]
MQASSTVIDNCLIDDFRFMSIDCFIPKEIVHKARTNLGVNISYQRAWRAKEHMVHCTPLEMDDSGHFKFFFMAFGALIEGWKYCRPITSVDRTFLKCKFGDILLTASSQDGNNQIFHLAFAITDSENDVSWT